MLLVTLEYQYVWESTQYDVSALNMGFVCANTYFLSRSVLYNEVRAVDGVGGVSENSAGLTT